MGASIMALLRRFGQLATLSKTALGQAMQHFRNSSAAQRLREKEDWPVYASELVGAHHTTQALDELVSFAIAHKAPVTLWSAQDVEKTETFLMKALESGNMKDVNSVLFLLHCHPTNPVPTFEVYSELVKSAPVGPPENQKLWRKTLAEMLYYSYPSCMNEALNDLFFANYGPISETLTAFMRLSVEVDDLYASSDEEIEEEEEDDDDEPNLNDPVRQQQEDFVERYISQVNAKAVTLHDYHLARDFVLHEVYQNLRHFPRDALCVLLNVAQHNRDYEFICRVYMDYAKFSVDSRPDLLVSCVLDFLRHGKFSGNRWDAVKQILREHLSRPIAEEDDEIFAQSQEPMLCQFPSTNDCVITALTEAGLFARAALYIYDCTRCALPYDPQLEITLAQHLVEKSDLCHLMALRDSSSDMLNNRKLMEWTEILRSALQKKGEVQESHFNAEKFYKATEPLLLPYLEGLGNSVAESADKDYAYSEILARVVTHLTPYRLDVSDAEHSEKLYESEAEDNSALAEQVMAQAEVREPEDPTLKEAKEEVLNEDKK